jgi:hypothetical protein
MIPYKKPVFVILLRLRLFKQKMKYNKLNSCNKNAFCIEKFTLFTFNTLSQTVH